MPCTGSRRFEAALSGDRLPVMIMGRRIQGFSIIELIAVLVIVGVLTLTVALRLGDGSAASVQSSRDLLATAVFSAQQIAMARGGPDNPVVLVVTASSLSITEAGQPVDGPGGQYPLALPGGARVLAGVGSYPFDKLGRTQAASFTLERGGVSAQVTLEASGYVHW